MDKDKFDKLIKDLIVNSDEFEGQNAIDLNNIDLCAPENSYDFTMPNPYLPTNMKDIMEQLDIVNKDLEQFNGNSLYNGNNTDTIIKNYDAYITNLIDDIKNGSDNSNNNFNVNNVIDDNGNNTNLSNDGYIIIEFGDEYTLGDKLDYTLHVKPGQQIDSNTIIATITQNGEQKQIRSIFNSGTILADEKTGDFLRIYPSYATRHIIISNTTVGTGIDYDIEDMKKYIGKMQTNGMLFSFIKDNLCYSILPSILSKREEKKKHYIKSATGGMVAHDTLGLCPCSPAKDMYNTYIEQYEKTVNNWLKSFKDLCSKDNIKSTRTSSSKMKALSDEIIQKREVLLKNIIAFYKSKDSLKECRYTKDGNDCRYLAWGDISGKKKQKSGKLKTKIGNVWYDSYYGMLISKLLLAGNESWNKKYYELLKGIIDNRLRKEQYTQASLINEFNELYKHNIQNVSGKLTPYELIKKEINLTDNQHKDEQELYNKVYTYLQDKITNKENAYACQQLANIFWYISNYSNTTVKGQDKDSEKKLDEKGIIKLVQEEKEKLETFWDECIKEYYSNTMDNIVTEFQDYTNSLNNYAEWPAPMSIPIEGRMYTLYEFNNFPVNEHTEVEEDIPELEHIKKPDFTPYIPEGDKLDNSAAIPEDVSKEITIKDTAYWMRYFSLATVISLPFLADGFDIPPKMIPVLLPAIYICFKAIYIPLLNIVLVIGLGIRGMWIFPILLVVNLNSTSVNGLLPLIIIAKNIQNLFCKKLETVEEHVANMAKLMISKLEQDNIQYNRDIQKYTLYLDTLKSQNIENEKLIQDKLANKFIKGVDTRQIIMRAEKLVPIPDTQKFKTMKWTEDKPTNNG